MVATVSHRRRPARRIRRLLAGAALATAATASILATAPSALAAPTHGCRGATTPVPRAGHAEMQRAVVCLINERRAAVHLPPLVASAKLDTSAQRWTDAMVSDQDFSHGAAFMNRISAAGFDWSTAGENIATGYATPAAVVHAWMQSPGHCANILDPAYREVGTGYSVRDVGAAGLEGTWTQDFGRLMGQRSLSDDTAPALACYRR